MLRWLLDKKSPRLIKQLIEEYKGPIMSTERRMHPRNTPIQSAYAALGSDYSKVGQIMDFSLSGLSIEYIKMNTLNNDNSWVEVFVVSDTFYIHNIHCRVVYDIPGMFKTGGLEKRRCGVKFIYTLEHQQLKIKEFLLKYMHKRVDSGY